jgi:tetratricopeptide (TPR) repeat protein
MAVERGRSVPSLREQRRDVSWTLESICRKCLAPDPAERYQQAEHVADDLRRYLEDLPLRYAPEPSQVERARKFIRRHPRVTQAGAIVSAAAVLLLAGAGVLTATQAKLKAAHARAYEAEGAEARERKQAFTTGAERARCLVNTTTGDPEQVREGLAVCERTLGLYEILDRYDWQQHAALRRLDVAEQRELAEDVREMLLLLASGKVFVATARASAQLPGDAAAVVAPGGPALTPLNVFGTLLAKQTVAGHQPSRQAFVQTALHEGLTLLERAERMPELAPSSALWHDRAAYLRRLGDTTAAARAEDQARTITAVSARDHYLLATAYGREHRLDDAIAQLKRALQLNPRHYWSLFELGTLEEERGEHTLAYGCFSGCVHLWPEFAWGYFNRARVLREMGRFPEALEEYTACLTHDAKLADAYLNRGQLFLNLLRHNEALADFERAAALGRDQARLHCGRGIALEGLHRPVEADAAFANAWARTAEDSDLLLAYAFAVAHRRPERALDAFNKVLAHEPRNTRALYGYAMLAQQQSRNSEAALLCLNLALQVDPTFVAARCARANVLAYRGECELARQDIDLCVKTEPTGVTLYAAACVYALIADKVGSGAAETFATRRALQLLQEALARGYGQDRAAGDSDLAHIQHHPEFRRLLRQHRDPRSEPRGG